MAARSTIALRRVALTLVLATAGAQAAGPHDEAAETKAASAPQLRQAVVAGGGGRSSGGSFVVEGSIGQPDVDALQPASGGQFAVTGGFWAEAAEPIALPDPVFSNGFEGGPP